MTAQQTLSPTGVATSTNNVSCSSRKDRPELVPRRSLFSKPHVFQMGRNSLKKTANVPQASNNQGNEASTKKTMICLTTTKTITTTKTDIVNGNKVVETTTTTITEPAVPKGLRGMLMKTLKPGTKTTQQVVTRQTVPLGGNVPETNHVQADVDVATASPKEQHASTPVPVPHGEPTKACFASTGSSSNPASSSPPGQERVAPRTPQFVDEVKPAPMTQTNQEVVKTSKPAVSSAQSKVAPSTRNSNIAKKQRGVKRVATPVPVPIGASPKSFFVTQSPAAPPTEETTTQKEPVVVVAAPTCCDAKAQTPYTSSLRAVPEEATTTTTTTTTTTSQVANAQSGRLQSSNSQPKTSLVQPKTYPARRSTPAKSIQSTSAPAGVPTMFAHAYAKTPKRSQARKQRPTSAANAARVSPSPFQTLAPVQEGAPAPATVPVQQKASTIQQPSLQTDTNKAAADFSHRGDDEISEYEEFTIYDDEITYYEEETVYSDAEYSQQQVLLLSAPKPHPQTLGNVKLEGMELLLANIRIKVPTVH